MRIILIGYSGSKKILSTSSYLLKKYMPNEFDIFFLNYGDYTEELAIGTYVSLDDEQRGGSNSWSRYLIEYLSKLTDDIIIFGLDDYLLSHPLDHSSYLDLVNRMIKDSSIGCAKLGISPSYRVSDYDVVEDPVYMLNGQANYAATTQLCIWRRHLLIDVLSKINNPWEFELIGSDYIQKMDVKVIGSLKIPLKYPEPSSISGRHPGKISVLGNQVDDIEKCIKLGYLQEEDLIMGQWIGSVKSYSECKTDIYSSLDECPYGEKQYYKMLLDICLKSD